MIAVATWVGISGTADLAWLKRLLPGGAATGLTRNAWNGGVAVADSLLLLAPTLGWVAVAVVLATRLFRWAPPMTTAPRSARTLRPWWRTSSCCCSSPRPGPSRVRTRSSTSSAAPSSPTSPSATI
ncbi:hypothetical protein V2I01_30145 [Micromonospora sp. BRA006-A]|nr:hypothetical protein [Micromonospora sp. BRA006-A]